MSSNIFYKALAAVSTVGIVVIAGIQVTTAFKKGNNAEDQLAKTMVEIKNARKDALREVKAAKNLTLSEVKKARSDALKTLGKAKDGKTSESVWLILRMGWRGEWALEKIETKDHDQCEMQGVEWMASTRIKDDVDFLGYTCLEGI